MNMKNKKIDSQARSNFLLSNAMFLPGFHQELEEIGRNWIKSFILPYEFNLYGLDKLEEIKNKKLHKKEIDNSPNVDIQIKKSIKKCFDDFIKKDGQNSLNELNKDLLNFANKYGLGSEVVIPLSTMLVARYWEPPKRPFFIQPVEDCIKNNNIILEIGPQTTCKDIVENWKEIEGLRKKLWPKNVIQRVTEKKIKSRAIGFLATVNKKLTATEITEKLWDNEEDDITISADRKRNSKVRTSKSRFKKRLKLR